jgi:hypothetical protein
MMEEPILHPADGGDQIAPATPSSSVEDRHPSILPNSPDKHEVSASSEEDYSHYKRGDEIDGLTIHHILLQYSAAIVFTTHEGGIYFRGHVGARGDKALVEFYRLYSKSTARLKKAYAREINSLLGSALAESLNMDEAADICTAIQGG